MLQEREKQELARLKSLLVASKLRPKERNEILAQIAALGPKSKSPAPEHKPSPDTPFGLIDRPAPRPDSDDDKSKPEPPPPLTSSTDLSQSTRLEEPKVVESEPEPRPSAAEIEKAASEIGEIVDRILLLRSVWATTLSNDVAQQESAWHHKLQLLATKLKAVAPDVLEQAMSGQSYLLTQPVREYHKPTMTQQIQERFMPSSVPSSISAQIACEFERMIERARHPVVEQRDPSYLPDGLQALIA